MSGASPAFEASARLVGQENSMIRSTSTASPFFQLAGVLALLGTMWLGDVATAADGSSRVVGKRVLVWHTDFDKARAEAQRRGVPLLVHFHASWCGPCRQMERDVLTTRSLASQLGGSVVAVKVDTDRARRVTSRYRVRLLPTDLLLTPGGKQLVRTEGYQGLASYLPKMTRAVTAYRAAHPKKPAASAKPAVDVTAPVALGLSGFSPVTLWTRTQWRRGEKRFSCRVGREVYHLASAAELERFRRDPLRFVPRLGGQDAVERVETGRRVSGSIRHAVFYDGGLYLFGDAANLARFRSSPAQYAVAAGSVDNKGSRVSGPVGSASSP